MSNLLMCDADGCGAFFAEGLEDSSAGVDFVTVSGVRTQRALHYCDECTTRRQETRAKQVFRPNAQAVPQISTYGTDECDCDDCVSGREKERHVR